MARLHRVDVCDHGRLASRVTPGPRRVQAKLKLGAPNDAFEQEAERVADRVMRMPDALVQRKCATCAAAEAAGRPAPCSACTQDDIRRKPDGSGAPSLPVATARRIQGLRGGGVPLPTRERAYFEPRFGRSFEAVRVHTDSTAAETAGAIQAKAFTHGTDVAFGRDQYMPGTTDGRRLLAHELVHVVQQGGSGPSIVRRSCANNFAGSGAQKCKGSIDVRAGEISIPNISFFHLYVVFTDAEGKAWAMRGGPGGGVGYGTIVTKCGAYVRGFIDFDPKSPSVNVYKGDDACAKARSMKSHLAAIPGWNIPYKPDGPNSNSVVASLLHAGGLPLRKPNVAAPGFDTRLTSSGTEGTGGLGDRRHRLLLQVNSFDQFATLGLDYSLDAFETSGLAFPIVLGAEYSFNAERFLGRLGVGVELPLVNLPTTPRAPTHLRLTGGVLAGTQPSRDPGRRVDALIGGYFQGQLGMDLGRFRISPFYRFSAIRNITTGKTNWAHVGGLDLGFAF